MKKIISALAVSALVFGSAAAKTSVNLNYRNGINLYSHTDNGEDGISNAVTSNFGGMSTYNGGQDTMSMKASGDVFDFQADIQPKVNGDLRFNVLKIGAKLGDFHAQAGWNGDGINGGYRVTNDASNWEGALFETFKLGSLFGTSFSKYADNQINMGGKIFDDREMYAQADYTLAFDDLKVKLIGSVISDRTWKNGGSSEVENNKGDKGWSVFADISKAKMFKAEAFVKGATVNASTKTESADDRLALVPGLYFQWLGTDNLIATVGGAASLYDGDLSDYSFDLRARYAVNKQLSFTYYLKYAALDTDNYISAAASGKSKWAENAAVDKNIGYGVGGYGKVAFSSDTVLWNFLNARYTLNPTVTVSCALGALTDLGDGAAATDGNNGTTLMVIPAAEFFAGKGASITVGLVADFGGIGAEENSSFQKEVDTSFAIPVLFRVKM